ncbi:MAG: zinc ribbon domain-containing protein [Deltaproteobacteria bacterium]
MPIYEFECRDCGETTEILIAAGETDLVTCSNCGGRNLKRIISAHAQVNATKSYPTNPADRRSPHKKARALFPLTYFPEYLKCSHYE